MWSGASSFFGALFGHVRETMKLMSVRTIEFFILRQYVQQMEEQRGKRRREQEAARRTQGVASQQSAPLNEMEECHRQAIAGLTLLGQRVPSLMGGYYRPTLQSIYGGPFTLPAAMKERREVISENVFLYRLKMRSSVEKASVPSQHAGASLRSNTPLTPQGTVSAEDIPLLVWFVMPWENNSNVILRFVLRFSQSLSCDTLFVTVPIDNAHGPQRVVANLQSMVELGRRKTQAKRVLFGGSDLSGMFVLLYLDRQCRFLQAGAFAAAEPWVARRAFCQGVILVDPFVGWEVVGPLSSNTTADPSTSEGGAVPGSLNASQQRGRSSPSFSSSPPFSAKERFKQVVMNSSGGSIQEWFPSPITYEAPPIVVLVDEAGFWLQEQCAFNTRIDRFRFDSNEERVFFLSYAIETAAVGTLTSASCQVELERLWRMVERFLSDQLALREPYVVSAGAITSTAGGRSARENNVRSEPRLRGGEVTFMAAFAP